ncbi:MAG TPA: SpoIIE family protein phosphatase [Gemmatimonadales bacterium]|nr:SpoIIE family protein phosphatase [Gemmatimonadales bacterium]
MEISSLDASPVLLSIDDPSKVGEVRRVATSMAGRLGLGEQDQGRLALVLTEAANNALQHGAGAEIVLQPTKNSRSGLEALLVDKGPGIADVERALRDGYSTGGTPGTGLGAVARLSDKFDIYSVVGIGTVLLIQIWSRPPGAVQGPAAHPHQLETGTVCLPRPGETACGDAWAVGRSGDRVVLIVADGLGHGHAAAAASMEAIQVFGKSLTIPPAHLLADIHTALRSTRGAAVAIASLDPGNHTIRYAGVGNIAGSIVTANSIRSMVSHNGTVGHEVRKIQEFEYDWPAGSLVIMQSDGLQTHWRLDRYPGLTARDPAVIAATLYRDYSRGRDDVTVLAVREATHNGIIR